ncbi:MAG: S49 family peptidase [Rhizomicrobium sp.]
MLSRAIRAAADDKDVKAIILRVDSPGGSVTASDQILDAVKKAQGRGKPVVVSMGGVAASGGYYISLSANRIVAEPGTVTGSIGVLTGKVSIQRSLALAGIGTDTVGVGRNALYNSEFVPYTPDQLAALTARPTRSTPISRPRSPRGANCRSPRSRTSPRAASGRAPTRAATAWSTSSAASGPRPTPPSGSPASPPTPARCSSCFRGRRACSTRSANSSAARPPPSAPSRASSR